MSTLQIIGASAGSGKTTRVADEITKRLTAGSIRPDAILATTFTRKAAAELRSRITQKLLEAGRTADADALELSLIGTVNSVCGQILRRFAFEAGLSPSIEVIDDAQQAVLLSEILAASITQSEKSELHNIWYRCQTGPHEFRTSAAEMIAQVMTAARINALDPESLESCKSASIASLFAHLPARSNRAPEEIDREVLERCREAARAVRETGDTRSGTQKYLDRLLKVFRPLEQGTLNWQAWSGLATKGPLTDHRALAEPVQDAAGDFLAHPRLQDDLRRSIELVFDIAARCLSRYQAEKQARNLIDFVDQERLTHDLLRSNPGVRELLSREIDLVVVDEFQDTSPLQLAIFVQLSRLAASSLWVGDPKQAIYDFRGTDPQLMQATIEQLASGPADQLQKSYRTRPALVSFTNAIFKRAFSHIDPAAVELTPAREEPSDDSIVPPLIHWTGESNTGQQITAAAGIAALLRKGKTIVDRAAGRPRALRAGDIAVLCRTNKMAEAVAGALREQGIAASQPRKGLLATREGGILLAAVRRYAASSDLAATAELVLLSSAAPDPAALLDSRLTTMEEDRYGDRWLKDHPAVQAVDSLPASLSILEAVELIIERLLLRWTAASFHFVEGEASGRIANVEAFRALAYRYEELCSKLARAATPGGFVIWLTEIESEHEDFTAADPGEDSVRVMTIHGAKGLEWPVVASVQLDADPKASLWGVSVQGPAQVDALDPLRGRTISYWPAFLGTTVHFPGDERFNESDIVRQRLARAIDENKRLQYVNFTRARDCQILLGQKFASISAFLPNERLPDASCEWDVFSAKIPLLVEPVVSAEPESKKLSFTYFARRPAARTPHPPAILLPSAAEAVPARVVSVKEYGTRLDPGSVDDETLGNALHAFLSADFAHKRSDRLALARSALERYSISTLDPALVAAQAERLRRTLTDELKAVSFAAEISVQAVLDGQLLRGQIDLLAETRSGLVIIDHKSFRGNRQQWEKKALEYSGQLSAYRRALEEAGGRPQSLWINFFSVGAMLELAV